MARDHAAHVAGEAHRAIGLQQQPVVADAAGPDRPLRQFERQQRQLGGRRHQAEVRERDRSRRGPSPGSRRAPGSLRASPRAALRPARAPNRAGSDVSSDGDRVAEVVQQVLRVGLLVRHVHHPAGEVAAHREVVGERGEQLVVTRPAAQQFHLDEPDHRSPSVQPTLVTVDAVVDHRTPPASASPWRDRRSVSNPIVAIARSVGSICWIARPPTCRRSPSLDRHRRRSRLPIAPAPR